MRLQGLRGRYGIAAPAPICADPPPGGQADCQVVQAPSAPGQRLVPDYAAFPDDWPAWSPAARSGR